MHTVTFLPGYRKIEVLRDTTILDAAQRAGLNINVVCGGQGKCGKCVVYVQSGKTEFDEQKNSKFFTQEELANGACLACQTTVQGDLQIIIPDSTLIQDQKILIEGQETEMSCILLSGNIILNSIRRRFPTPLRTSRGSFGVSRKTVARSLRKYMRRLKSCGEFPLSCVIPIGK